MADVELKEFIISCTEKATVVTSYKVMAASQEAAFYTARLAFKAGEYPGVTLIEANTYIIEGEEPEFDLEAD